MSAKQSVRSKAPRRQGRPPKDDLQALRDKIIAATRELLRTRPPDTISRIDIARAARVDPALIRYYFGTRDDVLSVVAQTFMNDFVSDSYDLPPSGQIQDLVHQMMHFTVTVLEKFPYMHDVVVREIGRIGIARGAKMKNVFIDRPTTRVEQALERTDSIRLTRRELQFFRMMTFALALFPIRERGFVEQIFGRDHFDAELTEEYCNFVAKIFAQGMKVQPANRQRSGSDI
jgi:TetR/AcrR family transcriptional regulator